MARAPLEEELWQAGQMTTALRPGFTVLQQAPRLRLCIRLRQAGREQDRRRRTGDVLMERERHRGRECRQLGPSANEEECVSV